MHVPTGVGRCSLSNQREIDVSEGVDEREQDADAECRAQPANKAFQGGYSLRSVIVATVEKQVMLPQYGVLSAALIPLAMVSNPDRVLKRRRLALPDKKITLLE